MRSLIVGDAPVGVAVAAWDDFLGWVLASLRAALQC